MRDDRRAASVVRECISGMQELKGPRLSFCSCLPTFLSGSLDSCATIVGPPASFESASQECRNEGTEGAASLVRFSVHRTSPAVQRCALSSHSVVGAIDRPLIAAVVGDGLAAVPAAGHEYLRPEARWTVRGAAGDEVAQVARRRHQVVRLGIEGGAFRVGSVRPRAPPRSPDLGGRDRFHPNVGGLAAQKSLLGGRLGAVRDRRRTHCRLGDTAAARARRE